MSIVNALNEFHMSDRTKDDIERLYSECCTEMSLQSDRAYKSATRRIADALLDGEVDLHNENLMDYWDDFLEEERAFYGSEF